MLCEGTECSVGVCCLTTPMTPMFDHIYVEGVSIKIWNFYMWKVWNLFIGGRGGGEGGDKKFDFGFI